jgi:hypothetical protein
MMTQSGEGMSMRRYLVPLILAVLISGAAGGWLIWRNTAPVEVHIVAEMRDDLPFDAETIPAVVQARPGEMIRVVYRIHNRDVQPIAAFGQYEVSPAAASYQMQVYLSGCGGLNTFENKSPADYEVMFRVQPAGLTGSSQLALRHVFTRAAPE